MNDATSHIAFPKSTLINFYLIAFGGVLNSTHFGDIPLAVFSPVTIYRILEIFEAQHFSMITIFTESINLSVSFTSCYFELDVRDID
jgi:hypothetical protein